MRAHRKEPEPMKRSTRPSRPPGTRSNGRAVSRRQAVLSLVGTALAGCGGGGSKTSGPPPARYGGLRVQGKDIVGLDGRPVTLRGMNWGRWGFAQAQDATSNIAQGANCVRIPLRWWGRYSPTTTDSRSDGAVATAGIDPGHLAILDQMVRWASAAGLWIILFVDSDCGQDGKQDADEIGYCDPKGQYPAGHNFWSDPALRAQFVEVWRFVADRYKANPRLGLFEVLPEPDPSAATDADITAFYAELTDAIRAVAPGVPFLIGARSYMLASAAKAWNPAWQDVVYTGDLFLYTNGTQAENIQNLSDRLQYLVDLRATRNVPVFVQQVGVCSVDDPDQVYLNAALSMLTTQGVGFAWWLYRDAAYPDGYGVHYQDGGGNWLTKAPVLATIQTYFRAPVSA
jgi:hypothetical protein